MTLSSTRRNNGFTLLELIVALALIVILCGALYGTYFSLMNVRDKSLAKMGQRRELSVTLDQLRRELSSAYFNMSNKSLHFVVEDRDYYGKPASTLDFTAIVPSRNGEQPLSDQVQLKYEMVAKEKRVLLTRQEKDLYYTNDTPPYPQMENLEGFLVECNDGSKWVKTWDTSLNSGRLPKYVKITVSLKEGDKTVEYSTIAYLRMNS